MFPTWLLMFPADVQYADLMLVRKTALSALGVGNGMEGAQLV